MFKRIWLLAVAAAVIGVVGYQARAEVSTVTFSGNGDTGGDCYETFIGTGTPTGGWVWAGSYRNYGGVTWFAANEPGSARSLLRFDVSSLAGQFDSIVDIELRLHQTNTTVTNVSVYRASDANSNWQEGFGLGEYTSWPGWWSRTAWDFKLRGLGDQDWAGGVGLTVPGVDYDPLALAAGSSNGGGWMSLHFTGDLTGLMNDWVLSPVIDTQVGRFAEPEQFTNVDNEGLLIMADGHIEWSSSEGSFSPELIVTLAETTTVVLDVKPGSDPNSVNLKSMGLLPVVVYGSEGLDVTEIDLDTLLLNGVGPRVKPNGSWHVSFKDVDGDLLLDLVMHFEMQALGIEPGMTELGLTGALMDGTELQGADAIRIVPDFNGDLTVNATDLAIMKHSYGTAGVGFELGDANADGFVDATDLALLRLDLGWSESASGEPIPEPATLFVMGCGAIGLFRRRRRA